MIRYIETPFSEEESLSVLNKFARSWFTKNFKELTPPQRYSFKLIGQKKSLLVTAPTGSGKTMSGFLSIISRLFDYSIEGKLESKVYCLYISPLRALNNDIQRNLTRPLEEIYAMIKKEKGTDVIKENIKQVTIGVRTGDTTQKERAAMLKHPPNILVTTPESLAILLNSSKFVENMKSIEYVIIDEIHELANNKRGVHLSLSIERLADITEKKFTRIGLGATLYPIEEAAKYLVGYDEGKPNDCTVVDASWSKKFDVLTFSPVKDVIHSSDRRIEELMYKELNRIITKSKTTLIFTNTRSGTERVVFNLKRRFKYGEDIAAHHGSLSRESRLEVEEMLKKGALKCAVTSTSLELGVDIGSVDYVVQLGSPKSVTRAIQRVGRAGHSYNETAKGEVIALNRDDLVECTVMLHSALEHRLDSFVVPQNALDVLAQHIVGMALVKKWDVDEAYELIKRVYAYKDLERGDFMSLINYLAGNYVGLESRRVYGKIWYDEKEKVFGKRGKYTKVIYMLNLGTIPDEVAVNVMMASNKKKWVGNIEEEFLMKLKPGDVFALGGHLYRFEYSRAMKCYVSEANAASPTIPPWFSEQLPLSYELANYIGEFRLGLFNLLEEEMKAGNALKGKMPKAIEKFLDGFPMDENAKAAIYNYFVEQILFTKYIPNRDMLIIEGTNDISSDKYYLIFHSLFGRRVNDTLSRAFAIKMGEAIGEDIGVMVSDNGFMLVFDEKPRIGYERISKIIKDLYTEPLEDMLKSNIRNTELMKRRFRHAAARGFMILRNYKGWKIGVSRQQINSQLILKAVEEMDINFPILKETYREILNDVMDLPRAKEVLERIKKKDLKWDLINTPLPSPFAHNLMTFGHADVIMMKDRRRYLKQLHKMVMKRIDESG
ncbi:MAG: ATP-dependent helicase [Candidatus Marsarchaeota archaeon]|nr:ATP-dependent helicase [Candidatus Marsarchaeota archaeon]